MLERRVVEPFGAAAKPVTLQTRDQQPQSFDLGQRRMQYQLQRRGIVGQDGGGSEHARSLLRRCESEPMNLA
ncbi:MAG TPA: hypothetical protein VK822_23665 [Acetobacteraceae bacterium]|nr:hypothetical protein [Acetobacteraceae bacterium]